MSILMLATDARGKKLLSRYINDFLRPHVLTARTSASRRFVQPVDICQWKRIHSVGFSGRPVLPDLVLLTTVPVQFGLAAHAAMSEGTRSE